MLGCIVVFSGQNLATQIWSLSPRSSSPSRVLRAISSSDDDGSGYWRNQAKVDEWIDGEEKKEKEDAF
ncbi:hypothetical protein BHM03_00020695 [Ensete ventricosum]|uniref:Uncharacterized protein n=1 Tax=Ensete ventricosum TaxID=4639 RepID=A0A427B7H3_ENSVE|nr:hypothetical protein B296_00011057 [Ensete ventricosum]RZR92389.1 hypothetical protein BHM03_00020695 [Ensete ventricosum]